MDEEEEFVLFILINVEDSRRFWMKIEDTGTNKNEREAKGILSKNRIIEEKKKKRIFFEELF